MSSSSLTLNIICTQDARFSKRRAGCMVLAPMFVTRRVHWIPLNFNGSRKRWMLLLRFPLDRCYIQIIKEKSI